MATERQKREKDLLLSGYSPKEIAKILNIDFKLIVNRNCKLYHVDCRESFKNRIHKDGIPSRLKIDDSFGYWFSGWIDGEGHFGLHRWKRNNDKLGYTIQFSVNIRDDDANVIEYVKDKLGIGAIYRRKTNGNKSNSKPTISFVVKGIQDLAEIIVPIFDRYPLITKKGKEFVIWKQAVIERYISTLGGTAKYKNSTKDYNKFGAQIDEIRRYKGAV